MHASSMCQRKRHAKQMVCQTPHKDKQNETPCTLRHRRVWITVTCECCTSCSLVVEFTRVFVSLRELWGARRKRYRSRPRHTCQEEGKKAQVSLVPSSCSGWRRDPVLSYKRGRSVLSPSILLPYLRGRFQCPREHGRGEMKEPRNRREGGELGVETRKSPPSQNP